MTPSRVAWLNLRAEPLRSLVAAGGLGVAFVLVFLQLGLLQGARSGATLLYEKFEFDLVIVSNRYQFLVAADRFDRIRLVQARAHPAVDAVASLNFAPSRWTDRSSRARSSLLLVGIDRDPSFVRDPRVRAGLAQMNERVPVIADSLAHPDYGATTAGARAEIAGREVNVVAEFALGLFFYADGSAIVSNAHFPLLTGDSARDTSVGLVRLGPGTNATRVRDELAERLPDDVSVATREQFLRDEQAYFVEVKPIGIIFRLGAAVALAVAAVILFQVQSSEVARKWREYAVLKAIGFSSFYLDRIVWGHALVLAAAGFVPAWLVAERVFAFIVERTHLPVSMDLRLTLLVAAMTLGACLVASAISVWRLHRCAPAELLEAAR